MRLIAVILCLLAAPGAATAGDGFRIVVNAENSVSSLSKSTLRRIYLGQITELDGQRVVPINLPLDSETAAAFLKEVVGKTPNEYKQYWVARQIKGGGTAPMIQKNAKAVSATIALVPGGIGYVPAGEETEDVKAVDTK
ncbi:MAG: hypothetical protein GF331_05295 [Chitinivibrionales bacterium]|nr:hypothetical protein [Chitinivibrionales bacterium]